MMSAAGTDTACNIVFHMKHQRAGKRRYAEHGSEQRVCSRCLTNPPAKNQRYCKRCHADAQCRTRMRERDESIARLCAELAAWGIVKPSTLEAARHRLRMMTKLQNRVKHLRQTQARLRERMNQPEIPARSARANFAHTEEA